MVEVKRGEIWLIDLNPTKGSEQRGVRPCLVISNDITNQHAPTITVLPLTSNLAGQRFPINVVLSKQETRLKVDSLVLCGQIRTVTKERIVQKLTAITINEINRVEKALLLYLGI